MGPAQRLRPVAQRRPRVLGGIARDAPSTTAAAAGRSTTRAGSCTSVWRGLGSDGSVTAHVLGVGLDALTLAATILTVVVIWKDEIANRRAMFALLDPLTKTSPALATEPLDLDAVDQLADTYERLYATADPAALLTPAAAHVRMLGDSLRGQLSASDRQRLLRNRARVAILAGRLAFERLHNPMSARAFFSAAYDDARELDEPTLRATVLGHTAQLAAVEGRHVAARDDLLLARDLVTSGSDVGRWLARMAGTAA